MKDKINEKKQKLTELTSNFCREYLDNEYLSLCEKLIQKMSRKRQVPFLSGKIEIWASAIIYSLGQINFLFDNSFDPYATPDDICNYFNTSKSTVGQKAKIIRDMFKMGYWNNEFATKQIADKNPINDIMMVNGLLVSKSMMQNNKTPNSRFIEIFFEDETIDKDEYFTKQFEKEIDEGNLKLTIYNITRYAKYLNMKSEFPIKALYKHSTELFGNRNHPVKIVKFIEGNMDTKKLKNGLLCYCEGSVENVKLNLKNLEVEKNDPNFNIIKRHSDWFQSKLS